MASGRPAGPEPRITTLAWLPPSPPGVRPLPLGRLTAGAISSPSTMASVGKLKGDFSIPSIVSGGHTPLGYSSTLLGLDHLHQPVDLEVADDGLLENVAQAVDVPLAVEHARLERCPLLGLHRARKRAKGHRHAGAHTLDLEVVLGVAGEELLDESVHDVRMSWHEDAGLRAGHAGLPRAFRAHHVAMAVVLGRVLTEVPDGAGLVLRIEVAR